MQTLDFFPPLVDDPFDFGRIAAANALSDVYAMGGEPLTALNLVGFPDEELDWDVLAKILNGGAAVVRESGAVIVGGHSVRDAEVKYGLSVTGQVHPDRIMTNSAAKAGEKLVLTKPIGSGVLTSAAKVGKLPVEELAEAIHVMTSLNRPGAIAAGKLGLRACTDITGFGLLGHVYEMAQGGGVRIVIEASRVPLMARTLELARKGLLTRAHVSTREHLGDDLTIDAEVEEVLAKVLLDAQTSGGLLLSVSAERCDELVSELKEAGALCAVVIGRVEDGAGRVRLSA